MQSLIVSAQSSLVVTAEAIVVIVVMADTAQSRAEAQKKSTTKLPFFLKKKNKQNCYCYNS